MGNGFKVLLILFVVVVAVSSVFIYHNLQKQNDTYKDYPFWKSIEFLPEPDTFSVMPNWLHEAEFAGFYVAKQKGFYSRHNLEVEILDFSLGYDYVESLRAGVIDFAVASPPDLINGNAFYDDLVVIAAVYQIFPGVYLTMENTGIKTPMDFCGKTVIWKNRTWQRYTEQALVNVGKDSLCVLWDNNAVDITRFLRGDVDIWTGYVQDEPIEVEMAGYKVREIYLYDYGFEDYAGLIVTRRDLIENKHQAVKVFLASTLFGWDYGLRNPEDAVDAIMSFAPELAIPFQRQAVKRITPFVKSGNAPIGWIDPERWARIMARFEIEESESILHLGCIHAFYGKKIDCRNVQQD